MDRQPRIALIHATRVAIEPIETAAARLWPAAEVVSILEEGLSLDRAKTRDLTPLLFQRIADLTRYAVATQADGVLYTCSAFGEAIQRAAREQEVPVMRPNEAMFDAALEHGTDVAMLYTFPPAIAGMELELTEQAKLHGVDVRISSVFCGGALEAKRAGDTATHDAIVADCASRVKGADVVILAQFSMASAAPAARQRCDMPVLTSPESAIIEMRRRVSTPIANK